MLTTSRHLTARVARGTSNYKLFSQFLGQFHQRRCKSSAHIPVRGTHDLMPATVQAQHFEFVIDTAKSVAKRFNYRHIQTPVLEHTHLFKRTLGEDSDVVMKEMYSFDTTDEVAAGDSSTSITLRPENTASVVRAVINSHAVYDLPQKLFYCGPMFRHERPQRGRLRQVCFSCCICKWVQETGQIYCAHVNLCVDS